MPDAAARPCRASAPTSLSSALCRPTSSRTRAMVPSAPAQPARVGGAGQVVQALARAHVAHGGQHGLRSGAPAATGGTGRNTSGRVSRRTGRSRWPAMARRRDFNRASQALEISSCTTMPSHCGTTSMPRTSAALSTMPLGQREAQCEVFQVGGRGQHGGVADAVVFQRDRGLLGQVVGFRGGRDGAGPDSGHLGGMLSWRSSAGWLMLCVRIVAAGRVWRCRRAVRARRDGIISPSSPRRSRGPARAAACAGCPRSATIGAAIPKAGTRA